MFSKILPRLVLSLLFVSPVLGESYKLHSEPESIRIVDILENVFRNCVAKSNYNALISTAFSHFNDSREISDILEDLLRRIEYVPVVLASEINANINHNVHFLMYFVESEHDVFRIKRTIVSPEDTTFNLKYFIILLRVSQLSDVQQTAERIFKHFFDIYIIDVTILINDPVGGLGIYTFFPYQPTDCKSFKPVLLQRFDATGTPLNLSNRVLFPNKISNFNGCTLKVVTWQIAPFVIITENSRKEKVFHGIDIDVLKLFAKILNFTLDIQETEIGGYVLDDGTATGAYLQLQEQKVNISVGSSSCTPNRMSYFSTIFPYFQMKYFVLVKAIDQYTSFEILLFPFDVSTWCLLSVFLVARFIIVYIFRSFSKIPSFYLTMLHGVCLIFFFTLRMSYESSIFKFMHNAPKKPLPMTLRELIVQNYTILTDRAKIRILRDIPDLNAISFTVPGEPVDAIAALDHASAKSGVFTANLFYGYYLQANPQKYQELAIVSEPVLENMLCIYFNRFSYLTEVFNTELLYLHASGILHRISKSFDFDTSPLTTAGLRNSVESRAKVEAMGLDMLSGVFMGLICMECLAFGIFLCEIFSENISRWMRKAVECVKW